MADDVDVGGFDNLEEPFATNGGLVGDVVRFMLSSLGQLALPTSRISIRLDSDRPMAAY